MEETTQEKIILLINNLTEEQLQLIYELIRRMLL